MRRTHSDPAPRSGLHECVDCGDRVENPDGRRCDCGGRLRDIGVPRE